MYMTNDYTTVTHWEVDNFYPSADNSNYEQIPSHYYTGHMISDAKLGHLFTLL